MAEAALETEKRELGSRTAKYPPAKAAASCHRDGNLSDESNGPSKLTPAQKDAQDLRKQSALAMEVPLTIVGAILLAGFLGYLADRWLHTSPWLMIGGGGLGFVSSMVEITRRFRPR